VRQHDEDEDSIDHPRFPPPFVHQPSPWYSQAPPEMLEQARSSKSSLGELSAASAVLQRQNTDLAYQAESLEDRIEELQKTLQNLQNSSFLYQISSAFQCFDPGQCTAHQQRCCQHY